MRKVILIVVVLLSASLVYGAKFLIPVTTQSTTHIYPDEFRPQSLNDAIHNETVNDGDTIIVRSGPYPEHLNVNKSITLEGHFGEDDTILDGGGSGIVVDISVGNVAFKAFTVRNGTDGIRIEGTLSTTISNVVLENNSIESNRNYGIFIVDSTNNILRNNNMTGNTYNFGVSGSALQDFIQDVDPSNTVNGRPIYYCVNMTGGTIPGHAGYVAVVNSTNVKVEDQNLANNYQGILLAYTNSCIVVGNTLSDDYCGIHLYSSKYNEVRNNLLTGNGEGLCLAFSYNNTFVYNNIAMNYVGIDFGGYGSPGRSDNNTLYRNNFVQNNVQVTRAVNVFDNGREGNYWGGAYLGSDLNLDGVGDTDTPYLGVDYYPLMEPWQMNRTLAVMRYQTQTCTFATLSNSTVATYSATWNHNLQDPRIGFNVTSGAAESINITIPRDWLDGPFEVRLNGESNSFNISQDRDNSYIYLVYDPGTYTVEVLGTRLSGSRYGDADNNGVVNILDAIILANSFGKTDW